MSNDKLADLEQLAQQLDEHRAYLARRNLHAQCMAEAAAVLRSFAAEKQAGPVAGEASAPALGERPRLLTMLPEARAALAALERIACNQTSQDHAEQFTHLREYLLSQQPATPPAPPSESDKEDAENYRWLANNCDGDAQDDFIQMIARNVLSRAEFDAAIRAARAKKEQP